MFLDVTHRHVVLTIPKKLRGLIEGDRALHGLMARVGHEVLRRALTAAEVAGAVGWAKLMRTVFEGSPLRCPRESPQSQEAVNASARWGNRHARGAGRRPRD